jgi:hypothetical protein
MTGTVAGDHDACVGQHQQQRDCQEVCGRSLAMSLMIPTDSAEGALHTSNKDWGGACRTWAVVVGDNAAVVDGRDGEEENAAIFVVDGEQRNGTATPQPPIVNLHLPNDVGAVVFPRGAASQAFQARRGKRDQQDDPIKYPHIIVGYTEVSDHIRTYLRMQVGNLPVTM